MRSRNPDRWRRRTELLAAVDRAGIIVLACPLYVDALPYLVVRTFELIAEHRRARPVADRQRFVSIMNCGFPEAHQNDTGLAICRQFTREVGFELTAAALAEDRPVPEEAVTLMAKPLIPSRLYTWLGTIGWKRQAKSFGAQDRLADRPFEAEADTALRDPGR